MNFGWKPYEVDSMSSKDFTLLKRAWNRDIAKQKLRNKNASRRK